MFLYFVYEDFDIELFSLFMVYGDSILDKVVLELWDWWWKLCLFNRLLVLIFLVSISVLSYGVFMGLLGNLRY